MPYSYKLFTYHQGNKIKGFLPTKLEYDHIPTEYANQVFYEEQKEIEVYPVQGILPCELKLKEIEIPKIEDCVEMYEKDRYSGCIKLPRIIECPFDPWKKVTLLTNLRWVHKKIVVPHTCMKDGEWMHKQFTKGDCKLLDEGVIEKKCEKSTGQVKFPRDGQQTMSMCDTPYLYPDLNKNTRDHQTECCECVSGLKDAQTGQAVTGGRLGDCDERAAVGTCTEDWQYKWWSKQQETSCAEGKKDPCGNPGFVNTGEKVDSSCKGIWEHINDTPCEAQTPGVWTSNAHRKILVEVSLRAISETNQGKDPYSSKSNETKRTSRRGITEASKGDDERRPHHDLVIRYIEPDFRYDRKKRIPKFSASRYHANQLRFKSLISHTEIESNEHPAKDCRWQTTDTQLLDFVVTLRRLGPVSDPNWSDRPAGMDSDASEKREKLKSAGDRYR